MKKCDEVSPSIILAGQALLVKMLITREPHGIIIKLMTLFKEETQFEKVRSSLRSSIIQHLHTYIQTYREFYNNY